MDLRIFKDNDALSAAAVEIFILAGADAVNAHGHFLVALSGGSTPSEMYRLLASDPYRDRVDWKKTFFFWGDERCVPPDYEGSNYRQALNTFLSKIPIPDENILRIKGEMEPAEAAKSYIRTLKRFAVPPLDWPRFDLVLLGMGDDGHTASLFPGSPVDSSAPALAVIAHYQGRPANRVTLTPPVLNSARKVLFLVTGKNKAVTLSQVLSDISMPEQYPAQRIQPTDGQVTWLIDEAAGSKLRQ